MLNYILIAIIIFARCFMANVKATDIVIIRDMLKDRENDLRTLTSQLTPDALKVFQTTLSLNWIPLTIEAEIL